MLVGVGILVALGVIDKFMWVDYHTQVIFQEKLLQEQRDFRRL